jgi:hypothetical protein
MPDQNESGESNAIEKANSIIAKTFSTLTAENQSLREKVAVLASQVENADTNLEQMRLVDRQRIQSLEQDLALMRDKASKAMQNCETAEHKLMRLEQERDGLKADLETSHKQVSQMVHLLGGGTLTEQDVIDSGLGSGVLIEQRHEVYTLKIAVRNLSSTLTAMRQALEAVQASVGDKSDICQAALSYPGASASMGLIRIRETISKALSIPKSEPKRMMQAGASQEPIFYSCHKCGFKTLARDGGKCPNCLTEPLCAIPQHGRDCTEPDRSKCPRHCQDFCNAKENELAELRRDKERICHIEELLKMCPHAIISYNDDPDIECDDSPDGLMPLGFRIAVSGCEASCFVGQDLRESIDKSIDSARRQEKDFRTSGSSGPVIID